MFCSCCCVYRCCFKGRVKYSKNSKTSLKLTLVLLFFFSKRWLHLELVCLHSFNRLPESQMCESVFSNAPNNLQQSDKLTLWHIRLPRQIKDGTNKQEKLQWIECYKYIYDNHTNLTERTALVVRYCENTTYLYSLSLKHPDFQFAIGFYIRLIELQLICFIITCPAH